MYSMPGRNQVWAYDHTGTPIYSTQSNDPSPAFDWGPTLAKFMDWDGDGCDDFLVGFYNALGGGGCECISGRTGTPLWRMSSPTLNLNLSQGLERCGDLDGDGLPDVLLGNNANWTTTGIMQAWSSGTLQPIRTWSTGIYGDSFGHYMNGEQDYDQDGIVDIVVSHATEPLPSICPSCFGSTKVFSGR
ncbi:MAG: VCBS repeat-containing protein, partial [Planctomycetes bacterium]|nr:VCBS repeat-containing protein [Planctomycetota bacterium]